MNAITNGWTTGRAALLRGAALTAWIRKTASLIAEARLERRTAHHLARLTETSPHLLADIGFVDSPEARDAACRVMVRGRFRIALCRDASRRLPREGPSPHDAHAR